MKNNSWGKVKKACHLRGDSAPFRNSLKSYLKLMEEISSGNNPESIHKRFYKETDQLLMNVDEYASKQDKKMSVRLIKEYFSQLLHPWVLKGRIAKRAYKKPRGYSGDYLMLEMIYDNKGLSSDLLGILFDRYLLQDKYVIAVRNRKNKMKQLMKNFIVNFQSSKKTRILNVASGGARDIREFFVENKKILEKKDIEFVFVDQDKEALDYSKKKIRSIKHRPSVRYVHQNITNFFRKQERILPALGKFDMIYSIGLIDYLPDILLAELIKFCFQLLNPNGKLFLAVKHTKKYKSLASDWFCDWNFYLRGKKDLVDLIRQCLTGHSFQVKSIKGLDNHISFVSLGKK